MKVGVSTKIFSYKTATVAVMNDLVLDEVLDKKAKTTV